MASPEAFYSLFFAKKIYGVITFQGGGANNHRPINSRQNNSINEMLQDRFATYLAKSFSRQTAGLKSSLYDNCVFRIVQLAKTMNFARDLLPMSTIDGYIYKEGSSCSSLSIKEKIGESALSFSVASILGNNF